MLKKIPVSDLRLGMHLHALEGPWLDHPFWKTRFVLVDPVDIVRLQGSVIRDCWIDVDKGVDLLPAAAPTAPAPRAVPAAPPSVTERAAAATRAPSASERAAAVPMVEELARASLVIQRASTLVRSVFAEARLGRAVDAEACLPLVEEISASVTRHSGALLSLVRLKTHDDYSYMHSVAVCALMVSLARGLGHDASEARTAGLAGLLHDLGKAFMPLEVLNKPGSLTDDEYAVMRQHPSRGHETLVRAGATDATALDVCLSHHERPDGRGYPRGLSGAALSLAARMGAVCDVYDAITSNRPYKSGWDPAESIARMAEWTQAGQFDPAIFAVFVKSLGIYPTGSLVRLQSGRLAVVVENNPGALSQPRVRVFFSTRSQLPLPRETIDLARPGTTDRIVGRESNATWKFAHLEAVWQDAEAAQGA